MFPPPFDLIECHELFNILNAEQNGLARISDPNYLYLLDCRSRKDYDESHVISANHVQRNPDGHDQMPWHAELETREHVILYDNRTDRLPLHEGDEIHACAQLLREHAGGLITMKIVLGGYELFSKFYPFLRTQRSLYSPRELEMISTYPNEICSQLLYLGRRDHALNSQMVKDLKIRAYVNCTQHEDYLLSTGDSRKYCRVPMDDDHHVENVFDLLRDAVNFISMAYNRGDPVLVYSDRGLSRSAAVIVAFISFQMRIGATEALKYVGKHRSIHPQQSFIDCIDQLNEKLQVLKEAMSSADPASNNDDGQAGD